jgi:GH24 family phage-related lysozyme (muramidase)
MYPSWQALPESVQQKFYGQFTKLDTEDQVKLGHSATQAKIEGDLVKQSTAINLAIEQGNFPKARESLEGMRAGLSQKQYETSLSKLETEEQIHLLDTFIANKPDEWEKTLTDAFVSDKQIPGMSKISKEQLPKFIDRARGISKVMTDRNYGNISASIYGGELKSFVDLENDPRYASIKDDKYKQSLKMAIADRNLGKPEGEEASKYAMQTVSTYPQTDDPATEATKLRAYANENVPSIFRDAVNKALDSKISEMASNGGRLKPETELVQYGSQRLAVARNGGVFGKFYDPSDVKGDATKAKANIEVMKQVEDVELILRNSGAKTRADVDRVVEEATASGIAKKNASEMGNQKGWFDFLNSKKAEAVKPPSWMNESKPQASISSVPDSTVAFVKEKEGFTPNRYTDSDKDIGSIGYGTYAKEGETTITEQGATDRLKEELAGHQDTITKAASSVGLKLSEKQQTALTSFSFNVGAETAAKVIRQSGGNMDALKSKMAEYKSATIKGVKKPILQKRRDAEIQLMASQQYTESGQG